MEKRAGIAGAIEIRSTVSDDVVARALWVGDPWVGDWEWEIRPEDPEVRKRLDACYDANFERDRDLIFGRFSGRRSPAWTSFEGLLGALDLALPGFGFQVGLIDWPRACLVPGGGVVETLIPLGMPSPSGP